MCHCCSLMVNNDSYSCKMLIVVETGYWAYGNFSVLSSHFFGKSKTSKNFIKKINVYVKRCSTLLIICLLVFREMQIKTRMRSAFILTRMAKIKNNNKKSEC